MRDNKPPMTVWLETIDEDGCGMWFDDTASPELAAAGPYVHLKQFMEEVERRADANHATTMRQYSSDFMEAMQELAKEIMEGKA